MGDPNCGICGGHGRLVYKCGEVPCPFCTAVIAAQGDHVVVTTRVVPAGGVALPPTSDSREVQLASLRAELKHWHAEAEGLRLRVKNQLAIEHERDAALAALASVREAIRSEREEIRAGALMNVAAIPLLRALDRIDAASRGGGKG